MKINFFFIHFQIFGQIFSIFMGIFGTQKMLICTLFWGGGGGGCLRKGMVCTLRKMYIYGWPLIKNDVRYFMNALGAN